MNANQMKKQMVWQQSLTQRTLTYFTVKLTSYFIGLDSTKQLDLLTILI